MGLGDYLALAAGAGNTIAISLLAILIGTPLGLGLALIRWGRVPGLDRAVAALVSLLRATPAVTLPRGLRFRLVVLPQIARAALPALVNEMTLLIKVSPAVAVIGVTEVTRAAVRIGATTYNPIPPFLVALAIYVVVIGTFVAMQRMLERRHRAGPFA
jgi:ABC-type amino acid transport system permease subunit